MAFQNPNAPRSLSNPFSQSANDFAPRDNSGTRFSGNNAPQAAARPMNSDVRAPTFPQVSTQNSPVSPGDVSGTIQGLLSQQVTPFVGQSQVPFINNLSSIQDQLQAATLPLLAQVLGSQAQRFNTVEGFFGPEMQMRRRLLDLVGDQSTLQQLLEMEEMKRPRSGGVFFKGF